MIEDSVDLADDSHLPMMERRPWTRRLGRQLPLRFRDVLPQPPAPLPPAHIAQSIASPDLPPPVPASESTRPPLAARVVSSLRRVFTTSRNTFGLSRQYYAKEMAPYDPEEHIQLHDLSNIPTPSDPIPSLFYPYPNHSAFRLGDWFWNGGVHKSQASFHKLMNIVEDPEFHPADIRGINWDQINKVLATDDEGEWLDEDAGSCLTYSQYCSRTCCMSSR